MHVEFLYKILISTNKRLSENYLPVVNNFPPLLEDDEDEDFEKFLASLDEEPEEEEDPDEDQFAFNDRFIQDFEDVDDML